MRGQHHLMIPGGVYHSVSTEMKGLTAMESNRPEIASIQRYALVADAGHAT